MGMPKYKILGRDTSKYIAVFLMFWTHLLAWVTLMRNPDAGSVYALMPLRVRIIAHISFFCPAVMFFSAADGWRYTRDRRKYMLRLLLFAAVTQPLDWLIFRPVYGLWHTNVLFTLLLGLLAIAAWESGLRLRLRVLLVAACAGLSAVIYSDWLIFGVLMILFLHIYRERPVRRFAAYLLLTACWLLLNAAAMQYDRQFTLCKTADFAVLIGSYFCMTVLYSGKPGRHPVFSKWFFYAFYPAHYLIIILIERITR